jgi:hypothetical protein
MVTCTPSIEAQIRALLHDPEIAIPRSRLQTLLEDACLIGASRCYDAERWVRYRLDELERESAP